MGALRDADAGATWAMWLWFFDTHKAQWQARLGGFFWRRPVTLDFGG
jgi:hypothetical protein